MVIFDNDYQKNAILSTCWLKAALFPRFNFNTMKVVPFLALLVLLVLACDTAKKPSPADATAAVATASTVYAAPLASPPVDSIPVEYTTKGVTVAPLEFQPMMGEWVADADEAEVVRFLPGKYVSYYGGEKVVEEHMVYYRQCPDTCADGAEAYTQPCVVVSSPYGHTCFSIVTHTENNLQLRLLGSNGTVLSYHRKAEN